MKLFHNIAIAIVCLLIATPSVAKENNKVNPQWQKAIIAAVDSFPQGGGYYTGRKATADFPKSAWRTFNEAFNMRLADFHPNFLPQKATPSFNTLATYGAMIQAILTWDTEGKISREAWYNLKPLIGVADGMNHQGINQADGEGCWGRANAKGPGMAVLIHELKVGFNIHAFRGANTPSLQESKDDAYLSDSDWCNHEVWSKAEPGDFMKIFWDMNDSGSDCGAIIGVNANKNDLQEQSHCAIFLGYTENGDIKYWSSNESANNPKEGGYGFATCPKTKVQRVVFSRVLEPENFNNAKKLLFNKVNKWLKSLNGVNHGTTEELKKNCGIK